MIPDVVLRAPMLALLLACLYGAHMLTSSETSYTWRLDMDMGKVMPASHFPPPQPPPDAAANSAEGKEEAEDPLKVQETVLEILMTTVTNTDGTWKKTSRENYCFSCDRPPPPVKEVPRNNRGVPLARKKEANAADSNEDDEDDEFEDEDDDTVLNCGKPVNHTYFDHLLGIQRRALHKPNPEPEVVSYFRKFNKRSKKGGGRRSNESEVDEIERKLKKYKRDQPRSVLIYGRIGNFLRIKGDVHHAIECFRRSLAVSPNCADSLLSLGKILFNLKFLDDAIFLTRRSLEYQPVERSAWEQHFQLGEILKAYTHYQEAALHLRHVLELKPGYPPAIQAIKDMEAEPTSPIHVCTVVIIVLLVVGVIYWIFATVDAPAANEEHNHHHASDNGHAHTNGNGKNGKNLPVNNSSSSRMRLHVKHNKRFL